MTDVEINRRLARDEPLPTYLMHANPRTCIALAVIDAADRGLL